MKMTIDLDNLKKIAKKGKDIFLKPEAEKELLKISFAIAELEEIYKEAKLELEKAALKKNPNFSSIESDKVKIFYRAFGQRFRLDEAVIKEVSSEMYSQSIKYSLDVKEIDRYFKEHKTLPYGINAVDRKKQITFKAK